jgi:hypothetical protein
MQFQMMSMMTALANQSSMWTDMMKQRDQREREELERQKKKDEDEKERQRRKDHEEYMKSQQKSQPQDSDDDEPQQVKWSGNIVLPKLEFQSVDSAMECGDWIARTAVATMDLSQGSAKWWEGIKKDAEEECLQHMVLEEVGSRAHAARVEGSL